MKYFWLFVFLLLSSFCIAQPDISGEWRGVITQNEGGFRSEYKFEMYFVQKGKQLTGRSYVYFDKAYAQMELIGSFTGKNTISFQELKIVDFTVLSGLEWCIKRGNLQLKKYRGQWQLVGDWSGATSFGPCIPGKVRLKKIKPQV